MSYTLNTNSYNTTGATAKTISLPGTNWAADWAVDSEKEHEVKLANCNASTPLDKPESFKFRTAKVPNIYKGTGINDVYRSPIQTGTRVNSSVYQTWSASPDSTESIATEYMAPASASLTVQVPDWECVTPAAVVDLIAKAVSGYFETADTTGQTPTYTRIARLLRQAERPKGI